MYVLVLNELRSKIILQSHLLSYYCILYNLKINNMTTSWVYLPLEPAFLNFQQKLVFVWLVVGVFLVCLVFCCFF